MNRKTFYMGLEFLFQLQLQKLSCRSDVGSEFCYQLSQICHNIQSINIEFHHTVSNGLEHLISSQNNLRCLSTIVDPNMPKELASIVKRCSNTLIKLKINY